MSLQHREDKRFSKKEPAMRTELTMAGSPVMIRSVGPDGGQEIQMGSASDMDAASVERMLDYLSPTRLLSMDKAGFEGNVLGVEDVNGQAATVVEFRKGDIVETYWFRQANGLLVQRSRPSLDGTNVLEMLDQYIAFGDNGLQIPAMRTSNVGGQTMTIRTAKATFNPDFSDDAFNLPR
jgi:outer membrane lipoprotein-sorting protein